MQMEFLWLTEGEQNFRKEIATEVEPHHQENIGILSFL